MSVECQQRFHSGQITSLKFIQAAAEGDFSRIKDDDFCPGQFVPRSFPNLDFILVFFYRDIIRQIGNLIWF